MHLVGFHVVITAPAFPKLTLVLLIQSDLRDVAHRRSRKLLRQGANATR
jgi:hypothetical protein